MDLNRNKRIIIVFALILISFVRSAFAYDDKTTHPALTDEIVDFYNLSGGTLSAEEKEWIIAGSTLEDTPPRWINHFYDPIHKTGWTGDKAGSIPRGTVQLLSRIGLSSEAPLSAVDWVNDYWKQEAYASYGGNRTWKRSLEYYADGNKKEAYLTLGHVLHLLEDMSVPDHTRDDTHAHPLEGLTGDPGSPYELWAEQWTRETIKSQNIAKSLAGSEASPFGRSSIAEYLTAMAEYSNKYFFSKDTINDPKYEFPKIVREDGNFGYGLDEDRNEFPLAKVKSRTGDSLHLNDEYALEKVDDPILKSYFSHLSRRVVLEGAGVIRLFKKQADEAVVKKEFPQHLVAIDPKVSRAFAFPNFSLFGIIGKLVTSADRAIRALTHVIGNAPLFSPKKDGAALVVATIPEAQKTSIDANTLEANATQTREKVQSQNSSPEFVAKKATDRDNVIKNNKAFVAGGATAGETGRAQAPLPTKTSDAASTVSVGAASTNVPAVSPASSTSPQALPGLAVAGGGGGSTQPALSGVEGLTAGGSTSLTAGGVSETPAPPPAAQAASTGSGQAAATSSASGAAAATATTTTTTTATTTATTAAATTTTVEIVLPSIQNFQAKFSTSTLNVNLSWSALAGQSASTTYVVKNTTNPTSTVAQTSSTVASFSPTDFSRDYHFSVQAFSSGTATSSIATTTAIVSDYFLNVQSVDANESHGSWYSDNWYRLGTGFYGTMYALTMEGYIDGSDFSVSHLTLKEFTDANYSHLNQSFTISDNAPFTATTTKVTIKNLNIPLQSNKFYRLDTKQDHQNLSVILKGTQATGTAMWNEFVSGTGGVTHTYSFYPYLQMVMAKNYPPLSAPGAPANVSTTFNAFDLALNIRWASSTDPDTNDSLLSYQLNYSTSSELSSNGWVTKTSPASINVVYPSSYTVGVRAVDDFGNVSPAATTTWSFPANFVVLPSQRDHSYQLPRGKQKMLITSTSTIDAVAMWLGGSEGDYCCSQSYMRIFTEPGVLVATSPEITLDQHAVDQQVLYVFDSSVTLSPNTYWLVPTKGPANTTNGTRIFGSSGDTYGDGLWLDVNGNDEGRDAYFRLRQVL